MALKGNLQDFSLTQLLNLINLANKSGALSVERNGQFATVYFRDGKLAYAQYGQEDNTLISILHRTKRLSPAQCQYIKAHVNGMNDKELGLLLINANYFSQQDILSSLQIYFVSILERLFAWAEGFFQFETGLSPPDDRVTVRVGLENVILEASRRLKELEHLYQEIPSLEVALKFVDRPSSNLRNLRLTEEEWKVISFVNPKNSLQQIARASQLGDFEIRRIAYSLLQAGIVELTRPPLPEPVAPSSIKPIVPATSGSKEENRSLIKRILSRIRSL